MGAKGFILVDILFWCGLRVLFRWEFYLGVGGHFVAKGFNLVRIPF